MPKLTEIDDLLRPGHRELTADDRCYALREYNPRQGYQHSQSNDLILNLKKSTALRGTPQWQYKGKAIIQVARELRDALDIRWLKRATLVPMPPSFAREDPEYDDRMMRVVTALAQQDHLDIRELLVQSQTTLASHRALESGAARPSAQSLLQVLKIDERLALPAPIEVGVFDDVLTNGAHFRAAKHLLQARFGAGLEVVGIFVARTVFIDNVVA